ncbi:VQ motif-containing protein 22-like [Durio zibethinus]|uniref:VQ motif-containing protein 22-like n=1 Tax=Durio zibethinus TaxID=66656 RepID=A0A6P6B3Q4_DURZI|nr:VQ motif-containing protein 22-like [Durio zibethinus]
MSSPTDWPQFYQQNLSNQETEATAVSTTITSSSAPSPLGSGPASSSGGHLSPEGRVGKPVRRRSRASRRTPTTLLNTDTTNFRAMVQQFTGGPSAPFAPGGHPGGPNFVFSLGGRQPHVNPSSLMVPPAGFQLQYHQQQQQQQQPQQHHHLIQHQNQPYMFSLNSNNNPGAGDLFLRRLGGNPRPNTEAGSEGFLVEGASSQVPPSRTTSSNENRSNSTFMF